MGFKYYFSDPFNALDCFIVMLSVLYIIVTNIRNSENTGDDANYHIATAFRGFRVIALLKLAKSWKRFHHLLRTMFRTLIDISTFTVVMFIFMFIFTILGMELFAGELKFDSNNQVDHANGTSINQNFDTFHWSFATVFVLLTADCWSSIWFALWRACDKWKSTLYVFSLYILGNRILLNLFLAILL